MRGLIRVIRPDNFADEVLLHPGPILLLCMPRGDDFSFQMRLLEDIAARRGPDLTVGLLAEEFIENFKKKLDIPGTPTFLIFSAGKEKNRMLGLADAQALDNFVFTNIDNGI